MEVEALSDSEKHVLVGLVRHLVLADGQVSDTELYDLIRLGVEIGKPTFRDALEATEERFKDRDAMLQLAIEVERPEARDKLISELERIAAGDGVHVEEAAFIQAVEDAWDAADG